MGEVYRARDTKLEREVKVLASLNHPNIAQIYGLEESNGVRALIMELVVGETLTQILQRAPLATGTALDYARQIANAFEEAHEKAVVHRDLKPANVMVTPAGVVKVLDFGLAAILQNAPPAGANASMSPTLTLPRDPKQRNKSAAPRREKRNKALANALAWAG